MQNSLIENLAKAARAKTETAKLDISGLDVEAMESSEELTLLASMSRLYRLADKRYEEIVNDHLNNFSSPERADRMLDVLTEDYVLDLPLSYLALSAFLVEMKAAALRYKLKIPAFWDEFIQGQYDYKAELTGS